jgi:hypothetical protein
MATREDIKNIMAYMGCSFPNYHPILEGEINTVDVLLDQLGDLDKDDLQMAVRAACMNGTGRQFAPSADEIRTKYAELHARVAGIPTAAEAWGAIMEHFGKYTLEPVELLENPLVKKAIYCMGGLRTIGMSENNMADRAHFLKIFEQLRERAIQETLELPAITEYIESKRLIDGQVKALAARMGRQPVLIEDKSRDN